MIKPPFTLLILKKSRHPVTIRVSTGLAVFFFLSATMFGIIVGSVASYLLFGGSDAVTASKQPQPDTGFVHADPPETGTDRPFDIRSLEVAQDKNGISSVTVSLSPVPDGGEVYVWLIVNPGAESPGELIVHPRNPLFKGLPVDYRNGIVYIPSDGGRLSINLPEESRNVRTEQLRVLVYSSDGEILTDRYYERDAGQNQRSSRAAYYQLAKKS